ncbi:hypothetical protein EVA_09824, partial [gut metagenome]
MNRDDRHKLINNIRKEIAKQYGLIYPQVNCFLEDSDSEIIPQWDAPWNDLKGQLDEKGIDHIDWFEILRKQLNDPTERIPKEAYLSGSRKRYFFKECAIKEWKKHEPEEWWGDIGEGEDLILIRDYNNRRDPHAVAVAFFGDYCDDPEDFDFDYIIGYVPKTDNELIAQLLDCGLNNTFIAEVTTKQETGTLDERLRMTIYVQNEEEREIIDTTNTYALNVDEENFNIISNELETVGFVWFQWGSFPISIKDFPQELDEVIFLCRTGRKTKIYRMKVIARGEDDAAKYMEVSPEDLLTDDDTTIFLLTNI